MNRRIIKGLGIAGLAVALTAAGGYKFLQSANAQSTPLAAGYAEYADAQAGAWLGIMIAPMNDQLAKKLGTSQTTGIAVLRVMPNSPAATAGLQAKDAITAIGGVNVIAVDAFKAEVAKVTPGAPVQL